MKAIYSGTFDPVTFGHIDIIRRGCAVAEKLILAVPMEASKKCFFTLEKRLEMLESATQGLPITIETFDGLLIRFAESKGINTLIRGVRDIFDFTYESKMANYNKTINNKIETFFLITSPEFMHLSSSGVKEFARHGLSKQGASNELDKMVPPVVKARLLEAVTKQKLQ